MYALNGGIDNNLKKRNNIWVPSKTGFIIGLALPSLSELKDEKKPRRHFSSGQVS